MALLYRATRQSQPICALQAPFYLARLTCPNGLTSAATSPPAGPAAGLAGGGDAGPYGDVFVGFGGMEDID